MAERRRDKKGRLLRIGESQRTDGRYCFRITAADGKEYCEYSWKLVKTDSVPNGKRDGVSLREKEADLISKLQKQLIPSGDQLTVLELVKNYILTKTGVRDTTKVNYQFVINILKKEEFAKKRISDIRTSDAKRWLIKLQSDGRGYSTIHSVRGVVRPAFQMAVEDDWLLKNPFNFELASVVVNDSFTREAITRKQEREFLGFILADKHFSKYYDGVFILFKTGLRISEFCGLTVDDLDMDRRVLKVDHQLQRTTHGELYIEKPKTEAGCRTIPMTGEVYNCFQRILANRKPPVVETIVDGKSRFLFCDKDGHPMIALHWEHYFQHIVAKYNSIYKQELPRITPHVCRHTYCSNMAKSGMNPKTLQYLMGHSEIGITMNTYTHIDFEAVKAEMDMMENDDV